MLSKYNFENTERFAKWNCFNCGQWNGSCGDSTSDPHVLLDQIASRTDTLGEIGVWLDTHITSMVYTEGKVPK